MRRTTTRRTTSRAVLPVQRIATSRETAVRPSIHLDAEAVNTFIGEMQKSVAELHIAAQHSDVVSLKRIAHYLHGAAAFVDAPAMVQLCRTLEMLALSGEMSRAEDAITALEIESAWLWIELNDRDSEQPNEAA